MEKKISKEDVANYIFKVFNNPEIQKVIANFATFGGAKGAFETLGNYLTKYYISTLDDSLSSAKTIIDLYVESYEDPKISFDHNYSEFMIRQCAKTNTPTLKERLNAIKVIAERNQESTFYTHCFPGALRPSIEKYGLDASREMDFGGDLRLLEQYNRTSFKIGKICFCELSSASLSYATTAVPERVSYALGGSPKTDHANSTYDFYLKSFKKNVEKMKAEGKFKSEEECARYEEAGIRIIDFYCSKPTEGIAIIEEHASQTSLDDQKRLLIECASALKNSANQCPLLEKQIVEMEKKIRESTSYDEAADIFDKTITRLKGILPNFEKTITRLIHEGITNYLIQKGVKNLKHGGFADGYGKPSIPREEIAIAEIPAISDMYFKLHRESQENFKANIENGDQNKEKDLSTLAYLEKAMRTEYSDMKRAPNSIDYAFLGDKSVILFNYGDTLRLYGHSKIRSENGVHTFSSLNKQQIKIKIKEKIKHRLEKEEDIESIIKEYRNSDDYEEDEEKDIEAWALDWKASQRMQSMGSKELSELEQEVYSENPQVKIKCESGKYFLITEKGEMELTYQCIANRRANAPYNKYFNAIMNEMDRDNGDKETDRS